jgi:WD40 repeat protein
MNEQGPRRIELFPIAIGEYDDPEFDRLEGVELEVEAMRELLEPFGAELMPWAEVQMSRRDLTAAVRRLRAWAAGDLSASSVLYWVGHGWSTTRDAALATESSEFDVGATGVAPANVAESIIARQSDRTSPRWSAVVIDTCKSKQFANLVLAQLATSPAHNVMLIGVSGQGATNLGRFTAAFRYVLTREHGQKPQIPLRALIGSLRNHEYLKEGEITDVRISEDAILQREKPAAIGVTLELTPALDATLAALPDADQRELVSKTQSADLGETAWYFEGRTYETRTIGRWLHTSERGMLVVTGAAGVGKSALLGHVLVNASGPVREALVHEGWIVNLPEEQRPPEGAFTATVRLTGATTALVVERLGAALGWEPPPPEATASERLRALSDASASSGATVMIDAVDEAQQPLAVAGLLREVADAGTRLVIGTRPSAQDAPGHPADDESILDALAGGARESATTILRVERAPDATREFIRRRLDGANIDVSPADLRRVMRQVSLAVETYSIDFLFASLLAHELAATPTLFDQQNTDPLSELLAATHEGLFAAAVDRLARLSSSHRALLEALALSFGAGMPIEGGVLGAASASLRDDAEALSPLGPREVDAFLTDAAPYVIVDADDGQTVYRLAHQTFREHFLARDDRPERHRRIAQALIAAATASPDDPVAPYLVRYLSTHIAESPSATWERLAEHTCTLDQLDPQAVTADAQRAGIDQLPAEIAAVIASQDLMVRSTAADREGLRQLGLARSVSRRHFPPSERPVSSWGLRSAVLQAHPVHIIAVRADCPVYSVLAFAGIDGPVLAAGCGDGTLRLWNPLKGAPFGPALAGGDRPIRSLSACVTADGLRLVAAGDDAQVRVWDPVTGILVTPFLADGPVRALAAWVTDEGELRIATATDGRGVAVWDHTGHRVGSAPHQRTVRALALIEGSPPRLVTGADDETARVWGLGGWNEPVLEHERALLDDWIEAVCVYDYDGRPLVAVAGDDRTAAIWDPGATGAPARTEGLHDGPIFAIGAYGHAEAPRLATAGADGAVRLWDAVTGASIGDTLTGHLGAVHSAATFTVGEVPRVATGGNDGTVRIWDPGIATPARRPVAVDEIHCITGWRRPEGLTCVATGDEHGAVRLWDAASGEPLPQPAIVHDGAIRTIAVLAGDRLGTGGDDEVARIWQVWAGGVSAGGPLAELKHTRPVRAIVGYITAGRVMLATGSEDGTVRIWDLAAGEKPVACSTYDGPVRGLAIAGEELAVVGSGRHVNLQDASTGERSPEGLVGARNWLLSVCAYRAEENGGWRIAAAGDDETVRVWDLATREALAIMHGHDGPVRSVATGTNSAGSRFVVSGGADGTVRIWNPASSESTHVIHLGLAVNAIHPLGTSLLVATDEGHLMIDLTSR